MMTHVVPVMAGLVRGLVVAAGRQQRAVPSSHTSVVGVQILQLTLWLGFSIHVSSIRSEVYSYKFTKLMGFMLR